jgi:hypothetical protein
MNGRDLHFHDLRGAAVTKFYTANILERVIAEIRGVGGGTRRSIIPRYVDRKVATKALIRQNQRKGERNAKSRKP